MEKHTTSAHRMLCKIAHPQCINVVVIRKIAFIEAIWVLCEEWYGCTFIVMMYFEDPPWDSTNSCAVLRELSHNFRFTTAVTVSSLASVRRVRERPAFTCAIDVNISSFKETLLQ
jgi:hypothetical protein